MPLLRADMPSTRQLDVLVARLVELMSDPDRGEMWLGETLSLWMLTKVSRTRHLRSLAVPLRQWQHLLYAGQKAWGYAISEAANGTDAENHVVEFAESRFAAELVNAMASLDARDKDFAKDCPVRLLQVSDYQLQALWVEVSDAEDLLLVVAAPPPLDELKNRGIIAATSLTETLAKYPPIIGRIRG